MPDPSLVNNPAKTDVVTSHPNGPGSGNHGGPLPIHDYLIRPPAQHPKLGLSAQLIPTGEGSMLGRTDFFFHWRGPHGSDGCIVIPDRGQFLLLMRALTASRGGILHVIR